MDISEGGKKQKDHKACLQEPPGLRQGCRCRLTTETRTRLEAGDKANQQSRMGLEGGGQDSPSGPASWGRCEGPITRELIGGAPPLEKSDCPGPPWISHPHHFLLSLLPSEVDEDRIPNPLLQVSWPLPLSPVKRTPRLIRGLCLQPLCPTCRTFCLPPAVPFTCS